MQAWPPILEPERTPRKTLTLTEWFELDEDVSGEFVAGELVEEEAPDAVHELTVSWLLWVVRQWLGGRGFVFGSDLKILTSASTGRKPDLVVFLPGTPAPPRRGAITNAPDILVEVVTPSPRDERRDRAEKMAEYANFGVRYYWLVDPALGSLEIFELTSAGHYQKLVGMTSGKLDSVPGCIGLTIDADALWAELSRLSE